MTIRFTHLWLEFRAVAPRKGYTVFHARCSSSLDFLVSSHTALIHRRLGPQISCWEAQFFPIVFRREQGKGKRLDPLFFNADWKGKEHVSELESW